MRGHYPEIYKQIHMNFFTKEKNILRENYKRNLWLLKEERCGARRNELVQTNICTLVLRKISHRNPLYSTRNLTQHSIANYLEKEMRKFMSLSIGKPSCCR